MAPLMAGQMPVVVVSLQPSDSSPYAPRKEAQILPPSSGLLNQMPVAAVLLAAVARGAFDSS